MKKMTTFVISKDVVKPTEEIIELIGQFRSEIPTLESEENLPFIILQDGARASFARSSASDIHFSKNPPSWKLFNTLMISSLKMVSTVTPASLCMHAMVVETVRQPISITLPKECIEWIDKQVESRKYHNRSHAIEVLILEKMRGKKRV